MKQRITIITLVFSLLASVAFAGSAELGTWNLNEKQSKYTPGSWMNTKVEYVQAGDKLKVTVWTVTQDGKRWTNEWVGKMDGKDYAVTGDPSVDMRSIKKVGNRTYRLVSKKGGKVVATGKIVYAADGKSRVVSTSGRGADGKFSGARAVYDKE